MRFEGSTWVIRLVRILAAAIPVAMSAPGMAQGADGVPDPISLRETMQILSRYMELQPDLRVASEAAHDRYLESFERLRESDVRQFMELTREAEGGRTGRMPSVEQIERMLDAWEAVRRRVAVLDGELFDEIAGLLDTEQGDSVARLRRVRARQRHFQANRLMTGVSAAGIDFAFWAIDPTEEEKLATDEVLRGFESAMPRLTAELCKASGRMVLELTLQMGEKGFGEVTREEMQDPDVMMQVMEMMAEAQRSAMVPTVEARTAIQDRELMAARGFRSRLAPDRWYRMKRIWASEAFPGAGLGLVSSASMDVPRHALAIRSVVVGDPDRVEAVDGILQEWYLIEDRITDDLIDLGREATEQSMLDPMTMETTEVDAGLMEKHRKRREAATRSITALLDLLPDQGGRAEIEARIKGGGSLIPQPGNDVPTRPGPAATSRQSLEKDLARITRSLSNIPAPIRESDLEIFAWFLDLEPNETLVIEALHGDYLVSWGERIGPLLERIRNVRTQERQGMPLADGIVAWGEVTEEALRAILRLDADFLDEIMAVVGDDSRAPAGDAMRIQRTFDRMESISARQSDGFFGLPVIEPSSPYRLLHDLDLEAGASQPGRQALIERSVDLRTGIDGWELDRLDSEVELKLASAPLETAVEAFIGADQAEDMAVAISLSERYFTEMLETVRRRRSEAEDRLASVQAVIRESVVPELPTLPGIEMQVKLLERGWSRVTNAQDGLGVAVRVLRMDDLDSDQISMLKTLFDDHLRLESDLIAGMSEEISKDDFPNADLMTRVRQISAKYAFRRGELEERLFQRLLVILKPEQIERIPSLSHHGD